MGAPGGVEPPTNGLGNRCSIQLSYGAAASRFIISRQFGTNTGPVKWFRSWPAEHHAKSPASLTVFARRAANDLPSPQPIMNPTISASNTGTDFSHAMRREIYEQPQAIAKTVERHLQNDVLFPGTLHPIDSALLTFEKLIIAASGSSRHAGLAGEIMIEDLSGVAVDVEYASEYCYRSTHAAVDPIVIVVTQSGETADTIAAQREALTRGVKTIAVSNVAEATLPREANPALITAAVPELAVPATKSFTTQVTVLYMMALFLARKRGRMTSEVTRSYLQRLLQLPAAIDRNLRSWDELADQFADKQYHAEKFLYLGRGVHYAIAREGALKLKETSYAHAEGYPAGELKHGPNALVDERLPVVVLATCDRLDPDSVLRYRRTLDVMKEVRCRPGWWRWPRKAIARSRRSPTKSSSSPPLRNCCCPSSK